MINLTMSQISAEEMLKYLRPTVTTKMKEQTTDVNGST
jgi:hypothetical protein